MSSSGRRTNCAWQIFQCSHGCSDHARTVRQPSGRHLVDPWQLQVASKHSHLHIFTQHFTFRVEAHMKPRNESFQDDVPFQTGRFLGCMLVFQGISLLSPRQWRRKRSTTRKTSQSSSFQPLLTIGNSKKSRMRLVPVRQSWDPNSQAWSRQIPSSYSFDSNWFEAKSPT